MKIQKTTYQNTDGLNMKTYIVTYFRHNPQLKNGGYTSTCKIEAVSIASARKKAREFCEGAVYGSRELLDVQKEVNG
jgi:hypothetical protein